MTLKLTCLFSVKCFAMDLIISYDSMCPGGMLCAWRMALKLNCLFSVEYFAMDLIIIYDSKDGIASVQVACYGHGGWL